MASETQIHTVVKTLQLNQNSQRQLICIADNKHVFLGIVSLSPTKWLVEIISEYADSYGSRVDHANYTIISDAATPTRGMERSHHHSAVKFRTEEFDNVAEDLPNAGKLSIKFTFFLVDTLPDFKLQRMDSQLAIDLWKAAKTRQFTDIELVVDGSTHHAHRAVLAARSPVFAAMFQNDADGEKRRIEITDVQPVVFATLLRFIYTGKVHYPIDNRQLYLAARSYQVESLQRWCHSSI